MNKTFNFIKTLLGSGIAAALAIIIVIGLACIMPAIMIVVVNTIGEIGGSDFHIDHGLFNYFVVWCCMVVFGWIFK